MEGKTVYILYSGRDSEFVQYDLKPSLAPLSKMGICCVDETNILPGTAYEQWITDNMLNASLILLVVSSNLFDSSKFDRFQGFRQSPQCPPFLGIMLNYCLAEIYFQGSDLEFESAPLMSLTTFERSLALTNLARIIGQKTGA